MRDKSFITIARAQGDSLFYPLARRVGGLSTSCRACDRPAWLDSLETRAGMRAATGLLVLVVGLLLLLRWNYNSALEAETTLAHAKLRQANVKLQAELATLKAQGEECKLQATAQQQKLQAQLEQSRTRLLAAASKAAVAATAAASTAAASATSPLEANLARSQAATSSTVAASAAAAWVPANSSAATAHAAIESEPLLEVRRHSDLLGFGLADPNPNPNPTPNPYPNQVHRHWDWASIA